MSAEGVICQRCGTVFIVAFAFAPVLAFVSALVFAYILGDQFLKADLQMRCFAKEVE